MGSSRPDRLSRRGFILGGLGMLAAACGRVVLRRPSDTAPEQVLGELVGGSAKEIDRICRRAWGAEPPRGSFRRHRIRRLTVHHSAVVLRDNRDAPGHFRAHQRAHFARGWPDIAYHILIDRNGNVYAARPIWARGNTATNYNPRGHLLVMCEGNFDRQRPSRAQVRALVDVLAWASKRYDVPLRRIRGHRQYADTACPGRALQRLIRNGTIRDRVRRRLRAGGVVLDRLCGRAGRRRVRRIENGTD